MDTIILLLIHIALGTMILLLIQIALGTIILLLIQIALGPPSCFNGPSSTIDF